MESKTNGFVKEDGFCILMIRGSCYKQVDVYSRMDKKDKVLKLYAKHGAGFYMLFTDGSTSSNRISCKGINCDGVTWTKGKFGNLEVKK